MCCLAQISKLNENSSENLNSNIFVFLFFIFSCIALYPLFDKNGLYPGHDVEYHLQRIEALSCEIKNFIFFPKIDFFFFQGRGYASSLFYNDLLLYPGALLRIAEFSPETSYRFTVCIFHTLAYISSYFCAKILFNSSFAGALCGFLYTTCQYKLCCLQIRSALGELQAFIFIPLVIFSLIDFFSSNSHKKIFIFSFSCLLLSHTISFLLSILFLIVLFVIFNKDFIKKIIQAVLNFSIVLLFTAFYWIPFLEMYIKTDLVVKSPWTFAYLNSVPLNFIINGERLANASFGINFAVFFVLLLLLRFFSVAKIKNSKYSMYVKFSDILLFITICLVFMVSDLFPWKYCWKLNMIQFPWRLYSFSSFIFILSLVSFLIFIEKIYSFKPIFQIILFFLVIISIVNVLFFYSNTTNIFNKYGNDYFSNPEKTYVISPTEWLPRKTNVNYFREEKFQAIDNFNTAYEISKKNRLYSIFVNKYTKYIDFPLIYYTGYYAFYENQSNRIELPCNGQGNNGLVRVYTDSQINGHIYVKYFGTLLQHISFYISLFSVIICLLASNFDRLKLLFNRCKFF